MFNYVNRRTDAEICGLALEAFVNVMSTDIDDDQGMQNGDLAVQFTEIFLKDNENVTTLLSLLEVSVKITFLHIYLLHK